jgi:hypothetical protein
LFVLTLAPAELAMLLAHARLIGIKRCGVAHHAGAGHGSVRRCRSAGTSGLPAGMCRGHELGEQHRADQNGRPGATQRTANPHAGTIAEIATKGHGSGLIQAKAACLDPRPRQPDPAGPLVECAPGA